MIRHDGFLRMSGIGQALMVTPQKTATEVLDCVRIGPA
jgi:hypothetical protein